MANRHGRPRLVRTLATGVKDMPHNASWLLVKAMSSGDDAKGASHGEGPNGVVDSVKHVGSTIKGVLPGGDSVEARLSRARAAADRATEDEQAALEAAKRAHDLTVEADDLNAREQARLKEVKDEQARLVRERLSDARKRADEEVAQEKQEAEEAAADVLSQERTSSEERVTQAREAAQEAQRQAEERYRLATERLAEAQQLADEAAAAANEAADQARLQAEQLAASARRDADDAAAAVSRAEEVRASSTQAAAAVVKALDDPGLPSGLSALSKPELIKLASARGVSNSSTKTKQQLVAALHRAKS